MKKQKRKKAEPIVVRASSASSVTPRALRGGRVTVDTIEDVFTSSYQVLAPFAPDDFWRGHGLDAKTLSRISTSKLIELLIDLSPDVSKGVWDFLRLSNPGWTIKCFKVDSDERVIDDTAQGLLDQFVSDLHGPYTENNNVPFDVIVNTLMLASFMRGGMFAELVLDKTGKIPLEIATPDPQTVRFKRIDDVVRGRVWQLGQMQLGFRGGAGMGTIMTPLTRATVVYLPVDPLPGKPFGRPLIHPAIFATLFLIGLLHDLRRVVAQQGYPRLDIAIDMEQLKATMPPEISGDPEKEKEWYTGAFNDIASAYSKLEPDDAFVHESSVTINNPIGAATGTNLTGIDGLILALERMLTKALKTMPLMMATPGSQGNQANANRQWEIQAAGIKALQHLAENLFQNLFTIALQVQGVQAEVEVRFAELRAAELLRDEQVRFLKIRNARMMYDNGTISADEMAEISAGKSEADVEEPRAPLSGTGGQVAAVNADPGSQRKKRTQIRNAVAQALMFTANVPPTSAEVDAAEEFFYILVPESRGILASEEIQ